jgi:hypothetical protein
VRPPPPRHDPAPHASWTDFNMLPVSQMRHG